jgi:hypothetical protein
MSEEVFTPMFEAGRDRNYLVAIMLEYYNALLNQGLLIEQQFQLLLFRILIESTNFQ